MSSELEQRIQKLEKRLERQQNARIEAEELLEEKSLELFQLNQDLEHANSHLARRIELAFSATGDGIWEKNIETNQVWFSERMSSILCDRAEEQTIQWEDAHKYIYDSDREKLYTAFDRLIEGDEQALPISIRLVHDNGDIIHTLVRGRINKNEQNEAIAIIGSIADISDLINERERVNALSKFPEKNPRPIFQFDPHGGLVYANPSAYKLTDEINMRAEELYSSLPMADCVFKGDGLAELEFELQGHFFLCTLAQWRQDGKDVVNLYLLDVTQRKHNELALAEEKKRAEAANIAKSDFLSTMSHELRTPLNGIIGLTEVLKTKVAGQDESLKLTRTVHNSSQSLLSLINDILDFSKIEAGEFSLEQQSFDLRHFLKENLDVFAFMAQEKGLNFRADIDANIHPYIFNDDLRIRQVINNLVGNAVKFTENGSVNVRAYNHVKDDIDYIYFEIEDTGIGIEDDKQNIIFNKFESIEGRSFGGTGLGLSISKSLIEMMGGEIGVTSIYGEGTCFWFRIKANLDHVEIPEETMADKEQISQQNSFDQHMTALIVDDHPTNLLTLKLLLESCGVSNVLEAESGEKALDLFRNNADTIDLIIMDYHMPDMNGIETTIELKKIEKNLQLEATPIIAATADAMRETQELCYEVGMCDYITKPIAKNGLEQLIQKYGSIAVDTSYSEPQAEEAKPQTEHAIDLNHLNEIIGENTEMREKFFRIYLEQAKNVIATLNAVKEKDNPELWKDQTHKLKGASANLGAFKMAELCQKAESKSEMPHEEKLHMLSEITKNLLELGNFMYKTMH